MHTLKMNESEQQNTVLESQSPRLINSLEDLKQETLLLFKTAKRSIRIYSYNLDPRVLNSPRVATVLKDFIRSSRYCKVEILIFDERNLQNIDHQLVTLAQNFTSNVQIRLVPKDYHESHFAFYLVDDKSILYRPNAERFETEFLTLPDAKLNKKVRFFNDVWQQSDPASYLRALHL